MMKLLPEIASAGLTPEEVAARLASEFDGDLTGVSLQEPDTVVANVGPAKLKSVARRLRDLPEIAYEMLNFVAAVDHRTRFESVYHLYSFASNSYLELHVDLPRAKPQVDTVCDVWPSADWHEREAFDMMGIVYVGHPDLRRILLRDDFVGYPLRKDYVDSVENHPNA
jgi:NADH-quinone oxidoreductase subunit C